MTRARCQPPPGLAGHAAGSAAVTAGAGSVPGAFVPGVSAAFKTTVGFALAACLLGVVTERLAEKVIAEAGR